MNLRQTIISLVDSAWKRNDLIVHLIVGMYRAEDIEQRDNIEATLDQLVAEGELIELEYVLPHSTYRTRSIYFPKGTDLQFPKGLLASLTIDDSKVQLVKKGESC